MNDKQIEFERKHFQRIRDGFREATKEAGNESLQQILKRLIVEKKYTEIVEKIKLQYDFTVTSMFMENIKPEWWEEYLTGNMHETPSKKIALTDFEGKLMEFNSIKEIYEQFIEIKNASIWKPYENMFTKIFTEWIVESVIEACKNFAVKERIDFIKEPVTLIEKQQAFEEYTKYQLNEQLNYYKKILELTLKDLTIDKFVYEDGRMFSSVIGNDKIKRLKDSLFEEKFDGFFALVSAIYASVPYQLYSKKESSFHTIFHVLAHLINNTSRSEEATNVGRIDTVIELNPKNFLFEFKLDNASKAIGQIKEMRYYEKYLELNKIIFLIGVSFSMKRRNINNWKVEKV